AIEGLDVAVLHRPTWRDVMPFDSLILRPAQDRIRGELGAVIGDDHPRLPTQADERRQLASPPFARDRSVRDRRQTLAGHVIDNVEDAETPTGGELIVDEVERPASIHLGFDQDWRSCSD